VRATSINEENEVGKAAQAIAKPCKRASPDNCEQRRMVKAIRFLEEMYLIPKPLTQGSSQRIATCK